MPTQNKSCLILAQVRDRAASMICYARERNKMTPNDVHWSVIGVFWASIVAAIIAVSATIINYLFFRSQVDPHLVVYATHDDRSPSIIFLIIENIGKSVAKDGRFEFSNSRFGYAIKSGQIRIQRQLRV